MSQLIFEIVKNFYILAGLSGAILGVLLWLNSKNTLACRLMSCMVLLLCIDISTLLLAHSHSFTSDFFLNFYPIYAVLTYGFIRSLAKNQPLLKFDLLHLLPITCAYLFSASLNYPLGVVLGLLYACYSLYLLSNFQRQIKEKLSTKQRKCLTWLKSMSGFQILIWLTVILSPYLIYVIPSLTADCFSALAQIPVVVWFFCLATFNLTRPKSATLPSEFLNDSMPVSQYFTQQQVFELKKSLNRAMLEDKLFLNPQLTVSQLAEHTQCSVKDINRFLHQELNTRFFDFVNYHRIEEAKRLLCESQGKILGIAFDAGFNSKSNFNKLFKLHTELTPSQYRKKCSIELNSLTSRSA